MTGRTLRQKLVGLTLILVVVAASLVALSTWAMGILSAVRAYVGGEGLYSKGQKDAIYHLIQYAVVGDEADYQQYLAAIAIPVGDRHAREELEKPDANLAKAEASFVEGLNDPSDVEAMALLFRRFRHVGYIDRAVRIWEQGDRDIEGLQSVAKELHQAMAGGAGSADVRPLLLELGRINGQLTLLEREFSRTLGEAARWLKRVLAAGMVVFGSLILALALSIALTITRKLVESVAILRLGVERVGDGDLETRIVLRSNDELGELASAVNQMTQRLSEAIEERARAEESQRQRAHELELSHSLQQATLELTADGILVVDSASRIVAANRKFAEMWRIPEELLAPRDDGRAIEFVLTQLVEPEQFLGKVRELYATPEASSYDQLKFKDGRVFERFSQPQLLAGEPVGRVWSFRDATERHRAEHQLRTSEERLQVLVGCTTGMVFEHDQQGRVLSIWTRQPSLLPRPREELLGRTPEEALGAEIGQRWMEAVRRVLDKGQAEAFEFSSKDGQELRWFAAEATPIPSARPESGSTAAVLVREVTENKQMEARLLVADRMASVGTLAAGVAHEINNPLAYVIANLAYLAEEVPLLAAGSPKAAELVEVLKEARHGADRVRHIVRDLKSFARRDDDEVGPVEVRAALETSINMAWNEIRHRAQLIKDYGDVPEVRGSGGRLGQVFLNLLVNAAQAIADGASKRNVIRVATRLHASGRVAVEIGDTGVGISPEGLRRLFVPFYTTKPVGVGTGLGLSICHNIVAALGGELQVTSEVGKGSTFLVLLPVAPTSMAAARVATARSKVQLRRARVLVLDDETHVVSSITRILSRSHQVVGTTSPRAGLDRIASGERFDVIICDLMMPELTGEQFHAEVGALAPEQQQRIVFLTGGAFTPAARDFLERIPSPRLEKPFEPAALLTAIDALVARWA